MEENLFGGPAAASIKARRSDLPVNAVVVSRGELNRMKVRCMLLCTLHCSRKRNGVERLAVHFKPRMTSNLSITPLPPLLLCPLVRSQAQSILRTEADVRREQEEREAIQAEKQKAARSRKERMLRLEAEAKQKVREILSVA